MRRGQGSHGPGVGDILNGRTDVEPFATFPGATANDRLDQPRGRMAGALPSGCDLGKEFRVDIRPPAGRSNRERVLFGNETEFALGLLRGLRESKANPAFVPFRKRAGGALS